MKVFQLEMEPPTCPACRNVLTGLSGPRLPKPGDSLVCFRCGTAGTFNDDLSLRLTTQDDLDTMDEEERAALHAFSRYVLSQRAPKSQAH